MVPCIVNLYYNKPTRCSCSQSVLFHCRVTLHVSGAFHTHHQEYIKLYLQPPVQVMLSLQLPSSKVAKFELVLKNMDILYDTLWYFSVFPLDLTLYRDADRSLARPGRKQVQTWPRWEQVAATIIRSVPEAVGTVLCTHDDGCGKHPKHAE